ncbi:MAG: diacylglycerol kinase family lipid kinase [Clostridia bacterium]|nr:diacylglycerol kinase family lipid kinase [Clostridia bacterium]
MYHIIVNPKGGKGKSLKALKKVSQILSDNNVQFEVHYTERAGHATEIARELSHQADCKILVMGGDGSFNEVLCGIENFENVTLGLIPCGTGNDFVRASGHPTNIKKAMDVILKNQPQYVDYIQLSHGRSLNVLGAGMDVDVLLKYASMKGNGTIKYYMALFHTLAHAKFHRLRITVDDGEPMERSVFMIGIGNGKYIGGGMPVCPDAQIDDGKLSIVVINELPKNKILGAALRFLKGTHVKLDAAEVFEGKKVLVEILDDSQFEADGEILPPMPQLEAQIVSNQLKIFR